MNTDLEVMRSTETNCVSKVCTMSQLLHRLKLSQMCLKTIFYHDCTLWETVKTINVDATLMINIQCSPCTQDSDAVGDK
jgi:hypothetical protein